MKEKTMQLFTAALALKEGDRVRPVQRLADQADFPALYSLLLEYESDLAASVSHYNRTPEERTMDAGGLASIRKLREDIEAMIEYTPETEPRTPAKTESKV